MSTGLVRSLLFAFRSVLVSCQASERILFRPPTNCFLLLLLPVHRTQKCTLVGCIFIPLREHTAHICRWPVNKHIFSAFVYVCGFGSLFSPPCFLYHFLYRRFVHGPHIKFSRPNSTVCTDSALFGCLTSPYRHTG